MTDKEKAKELSERGYKDLDNPLTKIVVGVINDRCLEMAKWKDEQFEKQGYTQEKLREMGFGFSLNGDIVTTEEKIDEIAKLEPINFISNSDLCAYQQGLYRGSREMAEWKERQMIEKAVEWLRSNIHEYYEVNEFMEYFETMFENFKKAMKGE